MDLSGIAFVAVPIAAVWAGVLLVLGRKQEELATTAEPAQ
jgi:hypothetical protein